MTWPTPGDYVEGTTRAAAEAYERGYAAGYYAAREDAQRAVRGAQIARAGVEAIDTVRAREKASTYPGARGPSRGWAA